MTIEITPKNKRGPLKIKYLGKLYTLPGRIPTEIITSKDSVPRPKVMAGSQKASYEEEVGVAVIAAFYERVIPENFKEVLDMEDIGQVFQAWQEHVGLGKSGASAS
ncbi:hypothetical protein [Microbacterium sp. MPKO10]|uniref:hypothetical protein n=1 Tax=Microbacterium sp. MPKO10 TaxID=2989818 RepID=UPI0022365E0C|nr:hypothetical protein [Microbacterium sp. MPKO10]MCW4458187.1 hypothetical protein [Microbacterium sp. MPKO10]